MFGDVFAPYSARTWLCLLVAALVFSAIFALQERGLTLTLTATLTLTLTLTRVRAPTLTLIRRGGSPTASAYWSAARTRTAAPPASAGG